MDGGDGYTFLKPLPRQKSFPPQLINLVFNIAEQMPSTPCLAQFKDPIGDRFPLLHHLDI